MTVARRFIAGSGTTWGLRPGGTPEYRRAIKRMYQPWAKPNFDRPSGTFQPPRKVLIPRKKHVLEYSRLNLAFM